MMNQTHPADERCVFCEIVRGEREASIVASDELTLTIVDLRQWHAGHLLIIPKQHVVDIRDVEDAVLVAVMRMTARIARAVNVAFPNDGLSIWHSAGEGANQEVPHLHMHVHPRFLGDGVLDVYPEAPPTPPRNVLEAHAARVRAVLSSEASSV